MSITIYNIMGNMASDPRTNVLAVTKGNGFSELKGFLKHDHFACKPTQFTFLEEGNILEYKNSKQQKGKRTKISSLHFTLFWLAYSNLGTFNGNILQAPKTSFFASCILTSLRKIISKRSPLETFHHTQSFTTY